MVWVFLEVGGQLGIYLFGISAYTHINCDNFASDVNTSYVVEIVRSFGKQVRKMLQLKEALDQRMGCVIVGPSGCGKSTLWSILRHAMIKCGQAVNTHVVNPKSMPRQVKRSDIRRISILAFDCRK